MRGKYNKKPKGEQGKGSVEDVAADKKDGKDVDDAGIEQSIVQEAPAEQAVAATGEGTAGVAETTESGRPKRAVRKSVRISEG